MSALSLSLCLGSTAGMFEEPASGCATALSLRRPFVGAISPQRSPAGTKRPSSPLQVALRISDTMKQGGSNAHATVWLNTDGALPVAAAHFDPILAIAAAVTFSAARESRRCSAVLDRALTWCQRCPMHAIRRP